MRLLACVLALAACAFAAAAAGGSFVRSSLEDHEKVPADHEAVIDAPGCFLPVDD